MMPLPMLRQLLFLLIGPGSYVLHAGPGSTGWGQKHFIWALGFLQLQKLFPMLWIIKVPASLQRKVSDDPTHGLGNL
jgi:hypothetical protein